MENFYTQPQDVYGKERGLMGLLERKGMERKSYGNFTGFYRLDF